MTLQRRQGLRRTGRPKTRSDKLQALMDIYIPRRNAFLLANPFCQYPLGCKSWSADVHHRRGRDGWRLLAEEWWASSCRFHNDLAETDTGTARRCGWLLTADMTPEEEARWLSTS